MGLSDTLGILFHELAGKGSGFGDPRGGTGAGTLNPRAGFDLLQTGGR